MKLTNKQLEALSQINEIMNENDIEFIYFNEHETGEYKNVEKPGIYIEIKNEREAITEYSKGIDAYDINEFIKYKKEHNNE